MEGDTYLFQGMTEDEIQDIIDWTESFSMSEERIDELRKKIEAQKTPEGKKLDELLRRKYLGE